MPPVGASPAANQPKAIGDSAALTEPARAGPVAASSARTRPRPGAGWLSWRTSTRSNSSPRTTHRDPQVVVDRVSKKREQGEPPAKPKEPPDDAKRLELEPGARSPRSAKRSSHTMT